LESNGDILTTLEYRKLFNFHLVKKGIATIGVTKRLIKDEYGVIKIGRALDLEDYIEKPTHAFHISMGVNVLNARCKNYINKGESITMPELFLRMKKSKEKIYCYESRDFWLDIGMIEDFQTAQDEFNKNRRRFIK